MNLFSALSAKIFGGAALALAIFGIVQTLQLSGARDANRLLTAQLNSAVADKRLCSASVDAAKMLADERAKRADQAMELARKDTAVRIERAQDILQIPVPTPDKECAATLELLKGYQQ